MAVSWEKIERVFEQAIELPPAERAAYLTEACAGDDELRREVELLIAADEDAADFIESPIIASNTLAGFLPQNPLEDTAAPNPTGERIGAYRLLSEIGRGGMGAVYLAERADDEFRKQVAIKLIKRGMDTDFIVRRFRNERQILATLDHPNIARLLDGGTTDDGLPYFVMEFIEGEPIHKYCDAHRLSLRERLALFQKVCSAVNYAHQNSIIHRDLKPGNILVTKEGVPKLLDFGIAKILDPNMQSATLAPTVTGMRMMTPEYASPEQVRGEQLTPASDIYSLGILLYELLTGHRPYKFPSRAPHDIARVICEASPENPETVVTKDEPAANRGAKGKTPRTLESISQSRRTTPEGLRRELGGNLKNVLFKALRKSPAHRFYSAAEFAGDIQKYLDGETVAPPQMWSADEISAPAPAAESLAVLPFRTLQMRAPDVPPDTGNFLSLGLADALITHLSGLKNISVRPTSSVLRYGARDAIDPNAAGRELKVTYVLDGRIQQVGRRVRVTSQLIKIRDNETIWAGQFDEQSDDILKLQDSISRQVVDALFTRLSGEESEQMAKGGTDNAKAYEVYLRGRFYWHTYTVEGLAKALVCFYEAIALDPNFALAYTGVADYYNFLSVFGVMSPKESFPAAREAAQKAIELDATLAEAYTSLGIVTFGYDWNFDEAENLFRRAVRLNPNYAEAHHWLGQLYSARGEFQRAEEEIRLSENLNPKSPSLQVSYALFLRNERKYAEALGKLENALAIQPDYPTALQGYNWLVKYLKNYDEAEKACRRAVEATERQSLPLYALAFTLAAAGKTDESRRLLAELETRSQTQYVPPIYIALVYTELGEREAAFRWIDKAVQERDFWSLWIAFDPRFDGLKDDARFAALAARIKPAEIDDAIHQSYVETKILPPAAEKPEENSETGEGKTASFKAATPATDSPAQISPSKSRPARRLLWYGLAAAGVFGLVLTALLVGLRFGWQFGAKHRREGFPQRLTEHPAEDSYAAPSPDGARIAFASNRDGRSEIYVMDADDPESVRRLTTNQIEDLAPSWSPDGKKILFDRITVPTEESDIYIMNADGSNQTRLTDTPGYDTQAIFSPDGTRIAFASNRGNADKKNFDIYVMNADGTNPVRLTSDPGYENSAVWSPDGGRIAYTRSVVGNGFEVFVMDADGGNQRNLTVSTADESNPAWSPDGRLISFSSNRNETNPRVSNLYVVQPDGAGVRRVSDGKGSDSWARWMPDSRRLVFFSNREGNTEIYLTDILQNSEMRAGVPDSGAPKRIAVLPFESSESVEMEKSLGDGLARVLTSELGQIRQLSVSPTFVAEGQARTIEEALEYGRKIGVNYILRGTLRRETSEVQVFAQLLSVIDGKIVWEERFDQPIAALPELQNEIAGRVLKALTVELSASEQREFSKTDTKNSQAYQLYLAGRYQMSNRTGANLARAIRSFSEAIEKDPNFAPAYAGLANASALQNLYQSPPPAGAFASARSNAEKALALDQNLSEAHAALGFVKFYGDRDVKGAEAFYRRAIELNPSNETAHHWLALTLSALGRHQEAVAEINTAKQLAPDSTTIISAAGIIYFYNRRYEEAEREAQEALKIDQGALSAIGLLRWSAIMRGDADGALAFYQREKSFGGGGESVRSLVTLAQTQAGAGQTQEARRSLEKAFAHPNFQKTAELNSFDVACAFALLDDLENTLEWLEKAAQTYRRNFFAVDPRFDAARHDPRFANLLQK